MDMISNSLQAACTKTPAWQPTIRTTTRPPSATLHRGDTIQFRSHALKFGVDNPVIQAARANDNARLQEALQAITDAEERRRQAQTAFNRLMDQDEPNPEAVATVLNEDIDVNARNEAGDTALHTLALKQHANLAVWQMLLSRNINIHARDDEGSTAWNYVMQRPWQHPGPIALLLQAGANVTGDQQLRQALNSLQTHPELLADTLRHGLPIEPSDQTLRQALISLERRPDLLVGVLQQGLPIQPSDETQRRVFVSLRNHSNLMAKLLLSGYQIQPTDDPSDFLANRLLGTRENYKAFLRYFGRENATIVIKQVLEAEAKSHIKDVNLSPFAQRNGGSDHSTIARRAVNNISRVFKGYLHAIRRDYYGTGNNRTAG
jgi:hypothetical protein